MKHQLLILSLLSTIAANAQYVTYDHDAAKMNQITVSNIGEGSLTPSVYYTLLHKSYSNTAAAKNKSLYRATAGAAAYGQVALAEALDSALIKRAEVEALNIADRQVDIAWQVEGDKIETKMADFIANIKRLNTKYQDFWLEKYNVLETAIYSVHKGYMPNSQRKKQYLQIYAEVAHHNKTLLNYIVTLANAKQTTTLLNSTYTKPNTTTKAAEALTRWKTATNTK